MLTGRKQAEELLRHHAEKAIKSLRGKLKESDLHAQIYAIRALPDTGPMSKVAISDLQDILLDPQGHSHAKDAAAEALRKIRGWAYPEEKPKDEAAPDAAPKTPVGPEPEAVEKPGQDAP